MYTLTSDEKKALMMVYTPSMLLRGEVVAKLPVRYATWMRMEGAPEYLHFINVQAVSFLGNQVRAVQYDEMYFPSPQMICYHLAPPAADPVQFPPGGLAGQFNNPTAIAVDAQGNVYVVDSGNQRVEKYTSGGGYIASWGVPGTGPGQFQAPYGVAVASDGSVYVVDTGNNRVQRFR